MPGWLAAAAFAATQSMPVAPAAELTGLNPAQLFALAERARANGRPRDAQTLLEALTTDPDPEIRAEARFRLAGLLEAQGRRAEAATLLRRILDEKPDAARVRVELARLLTAMGDTGAAARELRQAQAAGLPPDIARIVDQFRTALRSRAPIGATFEIAIAPDSNVNRATGRQTLDTGLFPIELSPDARARSGIGVAPSGQLYLRLPLSSRLSVLPRLSGSARLYEEDSFNDIQIEPKIGLEHQGADGSRVTLSGGHDWRWFGGSIFSRARSVTIDWLRPIGRRGQLTASAGTSWARFPRNSGQDGTGHQISATYEFAVSARAGAALTLSGARQEARDPGFASWSGGLSALYFHQLGRASLFGSAAIRRLAGDGPLFIFPQPRREWFLRGVVGGTFRQLSVRGFAPVVRVVAERNISTVGLFDYRRLAVEAGLSRTF
ncbi:tetratricopeptide repeat protein [Sphingomonas changnyeongensis]|uniref:Tetratricopeptide repeat protein n=2 Tax=Sphingomonas changnyeongensis TaxID=2698679 RepID=A0A7Z2NXJ5_9SPHN|nr:tetratricopeptide repeat protein [Sphingomonas changnyeongensis]